LGFHDSASVRAELAKTAPPIDYAASYDSLDIMEKVMRRFYLRGLIEEKMGAETDWKAADSALLGLPHGGASASPPSTQTSAPVLRGYFLVRTMLSASHARAAT
jgi:hypothetical protein